MGRWPTSLIKSWESALFSRRYGLHRALLEFLCCIDVPIDLRQVSQGIAGVAQRKPIQLSSMMENGSLL